MVGTGPFNFTVTPASTTTYTESGTDVNGCPITMSGPVTVTVSDTHTSYGQLPGKFQRVSLIRLSGGHTECNSGGNCF